MGHVRPINPGTQWHLPFPLQVSPSLDPFCSVFTWDTLKDCGQNTGLLHFSFADVVKKEQHSAQGVGNEETPHCLNSTVMTDVMHFQ